MNEKLEIYKMAAELSDRVSSRRLAANGFFLTVNTTLITILSFIYGNIDKDKRLVLIMLATVGIVLGITWFFAIRSYKRLNRAKFTVINEMEKDLPYQNFSDEWKQLKRTTVDDENLIGFRGKWIKFKDRYTDLTNIEAIVPLLFVIIFILILLGSLFGIGM